MEAEAGAYTCAQFLTAIFGGSKGFIELRPIPESESAILAADARRAADARGRDLKTSRVRRWLTLDEAIDVSDRVPDWAQSQGYAAFYGVLPRRERGSGKKSDILPGRVIWADLDFKDYDDGWDEARELLSRLRLEPSALVETGHGFHVYWLLAELVAPDVLERAAQKVQAALKADRCHNADRLMRLPGSWNVKTDDEPRKVVITHLEPENRYRLSTVVGAADDRLAELHGSVDTVEPEVIQSGAQDETENSAKNTLSRVESMPSQRYVEATLEGVEREMTGAERGSRNRTLNSVSFSLGRLVGAGALKEEDARVVLVRSALAAGLSEGEIARTIDSGMSAGIDNPWEDNDDGPKPRKNKNRHRVATVNQAEKPGGAVDSIWDLLDKKRDGLPKNSMRNACTVLELDPLFKNRIWMDEFAGKICTEAGQLTDGQVVAIRYWMDEVYGLTIGKESAHDALIYVAEKNPRHPLREKLTALEEEGFDGEPRCELLLTRYFGAEDTALTRSISKSFLLSCVVRAFEPGSKVDTVLILVGRQGVKKSTGLRALALEDRWFSDTAIDFRNKDSFQTLEGVWLMELAELDSMRRAESSAVKAFLSSQVDRYRPSYGRLVVEKPRQCVFVGSTNSGEFIADRTGSRRLHPVAVGNIDLDGLKRDVGMIWAETMAWYRMGVQHWLEDSLASDLEDHSEQYRQRDPWEGAVIEWLRTRYTPFRAETVLRDALNQEEKHRMSRADGMRIAGILKSSGCEKTRRRIEGIRAWWWTKPAQVIVLDDARDQHDEEEEHDGI